MTAAGVQTSVHYAPIPMLGAYAPGPDALKGLPVTASVAPRLLTLPLHPGMADGDVEAVVAALSQALDSVKG